MSSPMIAITTSSSTRVNPRVRSWRRSPKRGTERMVGQPRTEPTKGLESEDSVQDVGRASGRRLAVPRESGR